MQWHDIIIIQICWDEMAQMSEHKDKAKLGISVVSDLTALWDYSSSVQRLSRLNHPSPWRAVWGLRGLQGEFWANTCSSHVQVVWPRAAAGLTREVQGAQALPRCLCRVPALPAVPRMHSWVCAF